MKMVTVSMLCRHANKHRATVLRALKNAGVATAKPAGVKGIRVREDVANRFLEKQWPEAGHLPEI